MGTELSDLKNFGCIEIDYLATENLPLSSYDMDDEIYDTDGGLYLWGEMLQYVTTEGARGMCPNGWHMPSDADWIIMETELGGMNLGQQLAVVHQVLRCCLQALALHSLAPFMVAVVMRFSGFIRRLKI